MAMLSEIGVGGSVGAGVKTTTVKAPTSQEIADKQKQTQDTGTDASTTTVGGLKAGDWTVVQAPGGGGNRTVQLIDFGNGRLGYYLPDATASGYLKPYLFTPAGSGGGGGGGGGGGSSSAGAINSVGDVFGLWMGQAWVNTHKAVLSQAVKEGWTERMIIKYAVGNGANTPYYNAMAEYIKSTVGPITTAAINNILGSGVWMESNWESQIAPQYMTDVLSNPQSLPFMQSWNNYTAGATLGTAEQAKLKEIVTTFGFTNDAVAQWEAWLTTSTAALTGNYGAEKRAIIQSVISTWFGRDATPEELAPPSYTTTTGTPTSTTSPVTYGGAQVKVGATGATVTQIQEALIRQGYLTGTASGTYDAATEAAVKALQSAKGLNVVGYVGPKTWEALGVTSTVLVPGTDTKALTGGSLWNQIGGLLGQQNTAALLETLRGTDEYKLIFAPKLASQTEEQFLQWKQSMDTVGNWYFNDTPGVGSMEYNNSFDGFTNEELARMNEDGWTAGGLQQYYQAVEQAAYNRELYDPILTEAFGTGFTDDQWYSIANGGEGSGALKAQLVEAQNRVQFREAYREVFGSDPTPEDYARVQTEYISPAELIREEQAKQSVDTMFDEVNTLLQRVYGDGVTKDELTDMVLKRSGSGELQALIDQATKLDQYTWQHKQYTGMDATPDDYAKYAGYTGPAELQWEIVTNEAVAANRKQINDAMAAAGMDALTDEELTTLYGEQQGYGDLQSRVKEAQKIQQKKDNAKTGGSQVEIGYNRSASGGFAMSGSLGEL